MKIPVMKYCNDNKDFQYASILIALEPFVADFKLVWSSLTSTWGRVRPGCKLPLKGCLPLSTDEKHTTTTREAYQSSETISRGVWKNIEAAIINPSPEKDEAAVSALKSIISTIEEHKQQIEDSIIAAESINLDFEHGNALNLLIDNEQDLLKRIEQLEYEVRKLKLTRKNSGKIPFSASHDCTDI